ncbi:unnamed protein product [Oncorhynchus mykiss]|uniref:Concentrative nucleoside transporter N-terminal domain-containing protein n=1 Tax=Oncorhynchus mykiss TaxID=8022 RepID=A0A060YN39_ONCMY|nr:unnamed protein product [Oncorhynchus mykiss]
MVSLETLAFSFFLTTKHRNKFAKYSKHISSLSLWVSWRTLLWGVALQFLFGLIILRTKAGFTAVDWLGHQVEVFLSYADTGSRFVFGDKYTDHFFAFQVLPIVVFFSTVISMLYHLGFMQWLILKVGFIMQITMGTSPTESMVAAGNIFVGQTESPLLIRPYISQLTLSEIHAVMTGGFSTIAGSVLGAFISFGVRWKRGEEGRRGGRRREKRRKVNKQFQTFVFYQRHN